MSSSSSCRWNVVVSQTSRSNVRTVIGVRNSPNARERASLLRLTLRAQSRSETVTSLNAGLKF